MFSTPSSSNSTPRKSKPESSPGLSPLQQLPMTERQLVARQSNWNASASKDQIHKMSSTPSNSNSTRKREAVPSTITRKKCKPVSERPDPPGLSLPEHQLAMSERQRGTRQSYGNASTSKNQIHNGLNRIPTSDGLKNRIAATNPYENDEQMAAINEQENGAGEAFMGMTVYGKPSPKTTRKGATAGSMGVKTKERAARTKEDDDESNNKEESVASSRQPRSSRASAAKAKKSTAPKLAKMTNAQTKKEDDESHNEEESVALSRQTRSSRAYAVDKAKKAPAHESVPKFKRSARPLTKISEAIYRPATRKSKTKANEIISRFYMELGQKTEEAEKER